MANMCSSIVALQYDPTFNMAGRSNFTWPVMESANMLGNELNSYASDVSLTSPGHSRSGTASPPRGLISAEQRELKRQRDQARRGAKISQRQSRADSGSSSTYVNSPPVTMADLTTGASSLPIYTTAPSQISVLAEPVSTIAPQQYMPSYSPPLESQSNMFASQYSPQTYMQMGYSSSYPNTTSPSLPSHYG